MLLTLAVCAIAGCEPHDPGQDALLQARQALANHNYFEVIELTERAMGQGVRDEDVYLLRGHAYMKMGQVQEAVKTFDDAVKFDPLCGEALLYKGIALSDAGEPEQAAEAFAAARQAYEKIEADPQKAAWRQPELSEAEADRIRTEAMVNQALAMSLAGDAADAMRQMQKVRDAHPNYPGLDHVAAAVQSATVRSLMMGAEE